MPHPPAEQQRPRLFEVESEPWKRYQDLARQPDDVITVLQPCILDIQATPVRFQAEVAEPQTLASWIGAKLSIAPASRSADKAFRSGPLLGQLIDWNIMTYIPLFDRGRQRDAFFTRDALRYDREVNAYRCPAYRLLGYYGTNRTSQIRLPKMLDRLRRL